MDTSSSSAASAPSEEPQLSVIDQRGADPPTEKWICFTVKYAGSPLDIRLAEDDRVSDMKAILFSLTDVPAPRQKLIGLSRGKLPPDDTRIADLAIPPLAIKARQPEMLVAILLVGTPEAATFKDPSGQIHFIEPDEEVPDVDYLEVKKKEIVHPHEDPVNLAKLQKTYDRLGSFPVIHEPRPGKKLCVLDLDYTIADTKRLLDTASLASQAARPGLHDFLAAIYPYYDICVWSQTSWRWLEAKLTELNTLANENYKISFVLDRTTMFSIHTPSRTHEVKALELIWRRWPQYSAQNTIHIDDLSRNFAMNPGEGLKIRPYKNSPTFDTELSALSRYLRQLSLVPDFRTVQHRHWKHYVGPLPGEPGASASIAAGAGEGQGAGGGAGNDEQEGNEDQNQ